MFQVGLIGELSDAFLDCLVKYGLEGVPMLHRVDVTLMLEFEDGLEAIRSLLIDAPHALAPGGVLFLEHHHDQSESVQDLMREAGLVNVRAANDLEGIARFAQGQRALSSVL